MGVSLKGPAALERRRINEPEKAERPPERVARARPHPARGTHTAAASAADADGGGGGGGVSSPKIAGGCAMSTMPKMVKAPHASS